MVTNGDILSPEIAKKFYCEKCDYICSKQSDYKKHLLTLKHKNGDIMVTNSDILLSNHPENKQCVCECGKEYTFRQGLSVHKKNVRNYYTFSHLNRTF